MKPPVFNHQQYTDLEADYMILKAENEKLNRLLINMQEECDIADAANTALHGALEEAERREKAAVGDIPRICRTCKKRSERWLSDGRMDDYCVTCGKNNKCNWQWRGPQDAKGGHR